MSTPYTTEPGWQIIDTPELKAEFSPKLPTDECWSFVENEWHPVRSSCNAEFAERTIYRRRIQPVVQPVEQSEEWFSLDRLLPLYGGRVWFLHRDGTVYLCNRFNGTTTNWKQWRNVKPHEIPKPPTPPKSPAELAFEEHVKTHELTNEVFISAMKKTWMAALLWRQKQGKKSE